MKWFNLTYYNIKNEPEDSYAKMYNTVYQENKKDYFKIIIKWWWSVPHIPFEGVFFIHTWRDTCITFSGTKNNYWIQFRDSPSYNQKGKWKFRIFKNENHHCSSGC